MTNSSTFIIVGFEGSTTDDNFQIVLNDNDALSMSKLSEMYPGIIGLKYRDAKSDPWKVVANKDADGNLKPDDWDTWHFNMVYVPLYPISQPAVASTAPSAPVDEPGQAASRDRLFVFEKGW
ncbi:unnamed protein product [Rotaria sordida]|uniref:TAR DNA-binding protein 43 N-terminal domain-containing protein n=1 Tax=Rotaria sordida TaxID=392033 RepID=A0A815QLE1_9BILA|nr:unnamed protein product [Rotaria sordida]CAF1465531.1 unnamed protein product [Rotaria sordida]CAF4000985.1 unnamed protein product [Rotaria sordida]CAF4007526.1 unnamed protein product [Rotaria sordida]